MDVNCDQLIIVDADKSQEDLVYKQCYVFLDNLSVRKLQNIITTEFKVKHQSSIRIFNFNGIEILDDSDLYILNSNSNYESKNLTKNLYPINENEEAFPMTNNIPNCKIIYFTIHNRSNSKCLLFCFELVQKIGEGGFGKVYLAKQKFNNEIYALKFIHLKKSKCIYVNSRYGYKVFNKRDRSFKNARSSKDN